MADADGGLDRALAGWFCEASWANPAFSVSGLGPIYGTVDCDPAIGLVPPWKEHAESGTVEASGFERSPFGSGIHAFFCVIADDGNRGCNCGFFHSSAADGGDCSHPAQGESRVKALVGGVDRVQWCVAGDSPGPGAF